MKLSFAFRPLCHFSVLLTFLTSAQQLHAQSAGATNPVPKVAIVAPTNGAVFSAPANVAVTADVSEVGGYVHIISLFEGTNQLQQLILDPIRGQSNGIVIPITFNWTDVPAGNYTLTVVGTDTSGTSTTSAPVNITVTTLPVVTIVATDPRASLAGGTGTFTVYRTGSTSNSLNVFYGVGGSASNGVDYATLPNSVVIPAGASSADITVTPLPDSQPDPDETVILHLVQPPTLSPVNFLIGSPDTAVVTILGNIHGPPLVDIVVPANNTFFAAPADILIVADARERDGFVRTVEFFSGTNSIGIATNNPIVLDPPGSLGGSPIVSPLNPFHIVWTNVPAGGYDLTAVATDLGGAMATSAPVHISVITLVPPPTNIPPIVRIETPTNGATFDATENVQICAAATDPDGRVTTVQFFAGTNNLGTVTNFPILLPDPAASAVPPFHELCLTWSNVPPGDYALTAVAMDNGGAMTTSAPVNITVLTNLPPPPTNIPPVVAILSPREGALFAAPANIPIFAGARDPDGFVSTVEFFANSNSIGIATNTPVLTRPAVLPLPEGIVYPVNPFHLLWTNVPPGSYTLTAVATDNGGATATSAPVRITVISLTNLPPVVTIYATDPVAVETGTNRVAFYRPISTAPVASGTNTATFLVRRTGDTNLDLTVDYAIGGTASNGVDYAALPGFVTIPAGRSYALITIIPLEDVDPVARPFDTVILSLQPSPTAASTAPAYVVGWPGKAEAIILEELAPPGPRTGTLADNSFHLNLPGTNGQNFCIQVSTNLIDWTPVCTNTVVKDSIQFIDPEAGGMSHRYYRVVPSANAPAY